MKIKICSEAVPSDNQAHGGSVGMGIVTLEQALGAKDPEGA